MPTPAARKTAMFGLIVLVFALPPAEARGSAQLPAAGSAKACAWLPVADIEALYGTKVSAPPRGTDSPSLSTCTVTIAGQAIKVGSAPPGTPGVPTSVQQALAASQTMAANSKNAVKPEVKDYGDVGCTRTTISQNLDKTPLPKPIYSTACFQVTGGYLILTLVSNDASIATDEHAKALLAKAAALRKRP